MRVEVFEYPAGPEDPSLATWGEWEATESELSGETLHAEESAKAPTGASPGAGEAAMRAEFDRRLAEETKRSFEAGRERGHAEGRQAEKDVQAPQQAAAEERRMRQAAELIESFTAERDKYLRAVEHEVVELALAVAARILRREAQMDPLLLTGAVRVALGQLSGSTQVRLRVPPGELDLWTETVALLPNLAVQPEVLAGQGMRLGDCIIETDLGSVDLGIRSQLGEIERGFFDRAGESRAATSDLIERASQPAGTPR
jgi:flagellar assembly protein FliH